MRRSISAIALMVILSTQGNGVAMGNDSFSDDVQSVLAVEDEYVAAELNRDEETLRRIVDDRFVFNSNSGTVSGKAELIQSIMNWNMTGQTISTYTEFAGMPLCIASSITVRHALLSPRSNGSRYRARKFCLIIL